MKLILLGAPGAGKGTQGALIAKRYGVTRISTGDLLRDAVRRGTPLGLKAKAFMDAGELVPDDLILDLMREILTDEESTHAGFILDGFPRTRPQAEGLDELLAEIERPLDAVVVLEVEDDVLVKRISGRRACPECGAVYNVYFEPPSTEGRCDQCGAALVERADDTAETVRRRLAVYRENTEPLIEYYRSSTTPVHMIDGDRDVEAVFRDVEEALER